MPELKKGEKWVCAVLRADGRHEHTILLPGDNDRAPWKKQMEWAKSIGGDLPNRVEQAILFETMKDEFEEAFYWSNTLHASGSDCAWIQGFDNGNQNCDGVNNYCRARAVRRLVI